APPVPSMVAAVIPGRSADFTPPGVFRTADVTPALARSGDVHLPAHVYVPASGTLAAWTPFAVSGRSNAVLGEAALTRHSSAPARMGVAREGLLPAAWDAYFADEDWTAGFAKPALTATDELEFVEPAPEPVAAAAALAVLLGSSWSVRPDEPEEKKRRWPRV